MLPAYNLSQGKGADRRHNGSDQRGALAQTSSALGLRAAPIAIAIANERTLPIKAKKLCSYLAAVLLSLPTYRELEQHPATDERG
jgi:hypothetical protein